MGIQRPKEVLRHAPLRLALPLAPEWDNRKHQARFVLGLMSIKVGLA